MANDTSVSEAEISATRKSLLERVLDNFLHESSIQWMLVIGAAIVAASSLMLVTKQWTSWPVAVKYLTILSYTIAVYAAAEFSSRRLKLGATSQVLRCLTLVLIPIGFLSLSWLTAGGAGMANSALTVMLMIPAAAFMLYASDRIFTDWLRGRQWTFIASYVLLCLAGALPVVHTTWLAVLISSGFWLVMTLGVVKVNRHVFWLAQEHRLPRVFGFLPILILATLTVVLMATKTITAIELHWCGLGLVMMAGTVLMTTRTIADVFRQRTGDLVHPLPWSIVVPLLTGLLLAATGVLLSFHGFSFSAATTRAVVPTALIAAGLVCTIAWDTRNRGFAWAGLVLIAIAYQSCPALMGDLIQTVKVGAASAIREDRLPISFYGLTYFPLLVAMAVAGRQLHRRGRTEFSLPLTQFITAASVLLATVSLINLKAAFLVNAISVVGFVFYGVVLRQRRFMLAAIGSLIVAVATALPFANSMGILHCEPRWSMLALSSLGLLLVVGRGLDRCLSHRCFLEVTPVRWFSVAGEIVIGVMASGWVTVKLAGVEGMSVPNLDLLDGLIVATLFASMGVWTIRSRNYACGLGMWAFGLLAAGFGLATYSLSTETLIASVAVASGLLMLGGYGLLQYRAVAIGPQRLMGYVNSSVGLRCSSRLTALVLPLADWALLGFLTCVSLVYLPRMMWATVALDVSILPTGWPIVMALIGVAMILFRNRVLSSLCVILAPVVAGITLGCLVPERFTYENLTLVYAVSSAAMLTVTRHQIRPNAPHVMLIAASWLSMLAGLGFVYLSPITMVSSMISIITLMMVHRIEQTPRHRTIIAILASVQAILAAALLSGFQGWTVMLVRSPLLPSACVLMLVVSMIAMIVFERGSDWLDRELTNRWSFVMRAVSLLCFTVCLASSGFEWFERVLIVSTLVVAVVHECHVAIRRQIEAHVWGAVAILGLIVAWFHWHHQIPVPHSALRLLAVVSAGVCLMLARRWTGHATRNILVRTLWVAGLVLPGFVTLWSLFDSHHGPVETLIMFAASGLWFAYGRMERDRRFVVAAAAVANVALMSLFVSFSLSDPQLYLIPVGLTVIGLVEVLRRDIPSSAHDPIRYIGALAILVSPCFEILGGSWLHLVSLMLLSVFVILLAIGLRLRALVHVGTAFLVVDLIAMVIRSSIDHPGMLWIAGLATGAGVIVLAAVCEHHREGLLSRIRVLSDELATWR